ncbi:MAG: glycosyltransferase [bacterium]|nr:glycosyltransferase [bacterium]
MQTSLIVPTFNKAARLQFLLASPALGDINAEGPDEVVIVDDGSSDETPDLLEQWQKKTHPFTVKCIRTENSGRSAARNTGAKHAMGQLLIFCDDDMILPTHMIKAHKKAQGNTGLKKGLALRGAIFDLPFLKFFKDPLEGTPYLPDQPLRRNLMNKRLSMEMMKPGLAKIRKEARVSRFEKDIRALFHQTPPHHPLRWIGFTGGNISVTREDFDSTGGFDESFGKNWGCEDIELGFRLKQTGVEIHFSMDAGNFHITHHRSDMQNQHDAAMELFYSKHPHREINLLKGYFQEKIPSLPEWKKAVENTVDNAVERE